MTDDPEVSTPEEWLALPHTRTWIELFQAGEIPEFMYDEEVRLRSPNLLGTRWTSWPGIDEWALAVDCPACHAAPGEQCSVRTGGSRWHVKRTDRSRHNRDVAAAPWPEDRIPGRSYSSIQTPTTSPCGPVTQSGKA